MYKHKKILKLNIAAVLMAMLVLLAAVPVVAAPTASVELPITIRTTGDSSGVRERLTCVLEAVTSDAPMPENAISGRLATTVTAPGAAVFPPIVYDDVGEYEYRIYQNPGSAEGYTYDSTVYLVKVVILNGDTVYDKEAFVTYSTVGSTTKSEAPAFVNNCIRSPGGDDGNTGLKTPTRIPVKDLNPPSRTTGKVKTGDDSPILYLICIMEGAAALWLFLMGCRELRKSPSDNKIV